MNADAPNELPVTDALYTVMPFPNGITVIREPHAHPMVSANSWHIRGRDATCSSTRAWA